ncbi:hypothetical protein [Coxiella-like endosymbiont of Rhipicephalus sanguineus]|nr:hypothetical protein [Coxiella-like endosymbiont of Rhipicephalus sanguineus]
MITLDHVTKAYPGSSTLAVDNVSFQVKDGEILVLLTSSGSGKITLMK